MAQLQDGAPFYTSEKDNVGVEPLRPEFVVALAGSAITNMLTVPSSWED